MQIIFIQRLSEEVILTNLIILFELFKTYQVPVGCDCIFLTPPSIGTATDRFKSGQGVAIVCALYL